MKSKTTLLFNFLKRYLLRDTRYCMLYLYRLLLRDTKLDVPFYTTDEVLELIDNGKSIIRLGDGEIGLLHYLPIHYQVWSKEIRYAFLDIIQEYTNASDYILGIPVFVNYTNKELDALPFTTRSKKFVWLPLKVSYEMFFTPKQKVMDAHLFYTYSECSRVMSHVFSLEKNFICISDSKSIEDLKKNELVNKKIKYFIESPSRDTFEWREVMVSRIHELCAQHNLTRANSIIIFKAALSKTAIKSLSKDYQILDVGNGLDSYTKKQKMDHLI